MLMPRMQYFPVPQLFNPSILIDDGQIETPQPKLLSSNHCRDEACHELRTAPSQNKNNNVQFILFLNLYKYAFLVYVSVIQCESFSV